MVRGMTVAVVLAAPQPLAMPLVRAMLQRERGSLGVMGTLRSLANADRHAAHWLSAEYMTRGGACE